MKTLFAAAALAFSAAAAPVPKDRRATSPDGYFSLIPPPRFALAPMKDGGWTSPENKIAIDWMNFSANMEEFAPAKCNGRPVSAPRTAMAFMKAFDACDGSLLMGPRSPFITASPKEIGVPGKWRLVYRVKRTKSAAEIRNVGLDVRGYRPGAISIGGYLQLGDRLYRANAACPDQRAFEAWLDAIHSVRPETPKAAAPAEPEPRQGSVPLLR